jgi:hypothetical protein
MKNSKFLLAALVIFVASMVLSMLNYGFLLKDFYRNNAGLQEPLYSQVFLPEDHMNWMAGIVSGLASTLLLASILVWGGFTSTAAGARAGAIVCMLMSLTMNFGFMSFTRMFTVTGAVVDAIVAIVIGAVAGALGGMVLAKGTRTATT